MEKCRSESPQSVESPPESGIFSNDQLQFDLPSSAGSSNGENASGRVTPETPPNSDFSTAGRQISITTAHGSALEPTLMKALLSPKVSKRFRTVSATVAPDSYVMRTNRRVVYTAGRPPWYNSQGQLKEPFIIGICGGSASGKTTVANTIIEALDIPWVTLLCMDSFYKVLSHEEHERAERNEYNFDHPGAFDVDLLATTLKKLREGKKVEVPIYNFTTHSREKHSKTMYGADVLIFEGIMAFCRKDLVDMMDLKIFVDTDADVRLARRLQRDIVERGRDIDGVLKQYLNYVKPAFDNFIAPSMHYADIIIPRGGQNNVAINLIVQYIQKRLCERGFDRNRSSLLQQSHSGQPLPENLRQLPETPQIRGLHTFIRDRTTERDEFIFYSQRLMRLLIEWALSLLPFEPVTVETPQGVTYEGRKKAWGHICGVSILRAGETMEPALREVVKDCKMGKILIQTNPNTKEPELYYLRFPKDIDKHRVLLMDATVATGAAAMMAIRILLDHDVPEENIMVLSLLMAEAGVHAIAYAYPKVKLITTAMDPDVADNFHILPGIGNFGDRYFGTNSAEDDDMLVVSQEYLDEVNNSD